MGTMRTLNVNTMPWGKAGARRGWLIASRRRAASEDSSTRSDSPCAQSLARLVVRGKDLFCRRKEAARRWYLGEESASSSNFWLLKNPSTAIKKLLRVLA